MFSSPPFASANYGSQTDWSVCPCTWRTPTRITRSTILCSTTTIKQAVPNIPVIAAGRIQDPTTAESALRDGKADLVGLGRVLFADPLWLRKARGEIAEAINPCQPSCTLCTRRIVEQRPAYCARWSEDRRQRFLARVGG